MFHKIWNELSSEDLILERLVPLPKGYAAKKCPNCGSRYIAGAIISFSDYTPRIRSSSEDDPNILCLNCGNWDDAIP